MAAILLITVAINNVLSLRSTHFRRIPTSLPTITTDHRGREGQSTNSALAGSSARAESGVAPGIQSRHWYNVLAKLPKSQQPKAKRALQEIWMAETKLAAELA
ncbi:hypothetical protein, partial [Bradyrhizobium sp. CW10]|uniref:hypothetical protein n=1 Tax=Bradyrhizobium sp. CW10 TaxID=2782683 RepID=UPI001FFC92A4